MITHIAGEQHRLQLAVAAVTGKGTRATNEDYLGMIDLGSKGFCCALADGAGGHGNGALAARLTIDSVLNGFRDNPMFAPASLASLISRAEQTLSEEQPLSASRMYMSATVVLLCIEPVQGRALWAHWGDSRLYWFRDRRVLRMTEDHSVVQQLQHAGMYPNEDLRTLPNRNVLAGAVGAQSQVPPTVLRESMDLQPGDAFLLCSDGLWENLREVEMEAALAEADRPDAWLQSMTDAATAKARNAQDNISGLAVWITENHHLN